VEVYGTTGTFTWGMSTGICNVLIQVRKPFRLRFGLLFSFVHFSLSSSIPLLSFLLFLSGLFFGAAHIHPHSSRGDSKRVVGWLPQKKGEGSFDPLKSVLLLHPYGPGVAVPSWRLFKSFAFLGVSQLCHRSPIYRNRKGRPQRVFKTGYCFVII